MDARQKVLIVDDNPMNIRAMVTILQSEYECMVAKSGEDALEVANKSLPDIILLDIIMPDMDGYEVITELKKSEITKNIPVICISGLSDEYHEEQGLVLGAADYIHKENSAAIIKLRVKKQLQLMNALKEAEEASRAKSDFLAKMSHEIRTPMNSVIGITSIQLQKGGHTPETENAFLQIRSSSDMLLALINDILDLSKVEAGKMEVFPKAYETASLISDTVQLNLTHMERKNILFKLEIDENLPRMLIGDVIRVKQVFNNLLSNAFKYTDEGEVKFSVTFNENALFVNVADTGHGMTSEQVDALFGNEYIRFNEQGRRHIEGTGLGLNISHRLVSAMGGEISVESERGKGSTFRVKLLQGIEDATVLGKESADNLNNFRFVRGDSKRQQYFEYEPMPYGKVLVVDDLESNLYVAMGLMEPYALTVETASSAKEAIELVKDGEIYDVIFMDHMMPEMNGIEATKIIRDTGYLKPIVALTANIVAGQSNLFDNNGFDGFISKPIDVNILNSYLARLIRDVYPAEVVKIAKAAMVAKPRGVSDAVLEAFLRDAKRISGTVKSLFAKFETIADESWDSRDLELYTINVHGIKSALANIGEADLSDVAAMLEQAGRDANTSVIRAETTGFIAELDQIAEILTPEEKPIAKGQDADMLREGLKAIIKVCEIHNRTDARDVLYEIGKYAWTGETKAFLGKLSAYLLHSEFDEAIAGIEEFLKKNTAFLLEKLNQIADACKDFDPDLAYDILEELKAQPLPRNIKKAFKEISQQLLHGDYEKAADTALNINVR